MMKIVADRDIPFLKGVFEPYVDVVYKKGSEIRRSDLLNADALIVRTRTKCGPALLDGSGVKVIATATIGTDHIDVDWCKSAGIEVFSAAGCNAWGVSDYVLTAIFALAAKKDINLKGKILGIVGVGNVGSRTALMAETLGLRLLLNDPPREADEGRSCSLGDGLPPRHHFCPLGELLEKSDIVTLHVPLDASTVNLAGSSFFSSMKPGAIFINTSRGEVVDEDALLGAVPKLGAIALDCWKNEPFINRNLLSVACIATPHIAGYSIQGKREGTVSAVRSVASCLGISRLQEFCLPACSEAEKAPELHLRSLSQRSVAATLLYNYSIFSDDAALREHPEEFETLRSQYNYRREFYCR